jgi:hypothetical protein
MKDNPQFPVGTRVTVVGREGHPKNNQACTVLIALRNPSGRPENQWYDVQFDDHTVGRFAAKHLTPVSAGETQTAA